MLKNKTYDKMITPCYHPVYNQQSVNKIEVLHSSV